MSDFIPFPKIPRLNRDIVITEKIDGTNASVLVPEDDGPILVGSRTRFITPDADNFGFARHVAEHDDAFRALGPGRHFGEWWGQGIQRGYGLTEKRFSLFNTGKWNAENAPEGLHVVPVLYAGPNRDEEIDFALVTLSCGSVAAPGFTKPEGIIIYHTAANSYFKVTLEGDEKPKGQVTA